MSWVQRLLGHQRMVFAIVAVMCVAGIAAWKTMVRQEDPRLPNYWGQIVVPYPGADAEQVEQQVLDPVEDHLAEVSQVGWVESTAFAEVAVITMELRPDTKDFREAWDDVREALSRAQREFPEGAMAPELDDDLEEQESTVLAVTGSSDPLQLMAAARELRAELLGVPTVSKVNFICDPGEQVTVEVDDAAARRLGTTTTVLAYQLASRNRTLPGGSIRVGDSNMQLRPHTAFDSVEQIESTAVSLPSGNAVPLNAFANVRRGPTEPPMSRMRVNGEIAVGLGVVPKKAVNTVEFGEQVREVVTRVSPRLQGIHVQEVAFQPAIVAWRLEDLGRSLIMGVLIVAGVLVVAMGPRLGLVVASVVPLVVLSSIAVFAAGGGVLHQISIAALVIALGMLVDNAIVVAENVQWQLDHGASRTEAAMRAVRELAVPLAGATGTTLAAFVPMLLAPGPTAAFTRSIPVVVMITLATSYLFAIFVTPSLSRWALAPKQSDEESRVEKVGSQLARIAVHHPYAVLGSVAVVLFVSAVAAGQVKQQFFPSSDRAQATIDLRLPAGTHLDRTDASARQLERALLSRDDVVAVSTFVGRSAPHFYYNLPQVPWSPHFAQLVVDTRDPESTGNVLQWVRDYVRTEQIGVEVVARKLEQGPPVAAPIEIRVFGHDPEAAHETASAVVSALREIPGTRDVRHDMDPGSPSLDIAIDDAAAGRHEVSRSDVASSLYGCTRGLPIGELRTGDDPVPVVLRSAAGEELSVNGLHTIDIAAPGKPPVPLAQLARTAPAWRPASIRHRDRKRVVTVSAQLAEGTTYSEVLDQLRPELAKLELPNGVTIGYGGEEEGSDEASGALYGALPVGLLLLLGVLLAEFNSIRRVTIVLITVPLAVAGVVPGLLVGGQPFGFTAFMGAIALVGVVVNNAIMLIEVIDQRMAEGASRDRAIEDAVQRRIRPILLTTATTVAGLIPLAVSSSTLWPPLAFAMISGLGASTGLTLIVVPALMHWVLPGSAGAGLTVEPRPWTARSPIDPASR